MIELFPKRLRFTAKIAIQNPQVIFQKKHENSDEMSYYADEVTGEFYRIIPTSAREIDFFSRCKKYSEIFAPAIGNGLIVRCDVIDSIDPPAKNLK
jgi:hypothetical protein